MRTFINLYIILLLTIFTTACAAQNISESQNISENKDTSANKDYGVFLSINASETEKLNGYKTVVIDAQYFSKQDIQTLHNNGTTVYTYLNIGSIENFRDYYPEYEDLTLGDYENWEEEKWIDVSDAKWQAFIADLSTMLLEKGIDGFFIDNCDVYYYKQSEEIFLGLTKILRGLKSLEKDVIINGGDTYITQYCQTCGSAKDIMSAVNQEEVFSSYDFDTASFGTNEAEEKAYFSDYIEACRADGMDVYLLEYTTNRNLITQIETYCKEKGFHYYIADSIELD